MNAILILVALGVGVSDRRDGGVHGRLEQHPLSSPSRWILEWFEEVGKGDKRRGSLSIEKDACGVLDVFPRAAWQITACRVKGGYESGTFEWDIQWVNELGAGKDTLYGIYRVRDNRLWVCFNNREDKPPTDFTTRFDESRTVLILRRGK